MAFNQKTVLFPLWAHFARSCSTASSGSDSDCTFGPFEVPLRVALSDLAPPIKYLWKALKLTNPWAMAGARGELRRSERRNTVNTFKSHRAMPAARQIQRYYGNFHILLHALSHSSGAAEGQAAAQGRTWGSLYGSSGGGGGRGAAAKCVVYLHFLAKELCIFLSFSLHSTALLLPPRLSPHFSLPSLPVLHVKFRYHSSSSCSSCNKISGKGCRQQPAGVSLGVHFMTLTLPSPPPRSPSLSFSLCVWPVKCKAFG